MWDIFVQGKKKRIVRHQTRSYIAWRSCFPRVSLSHFNNIVNKYLLQPNSTCFFFLIICVCVSYYDQLPLYHQRRRPVGQFWSLYWISVSFLQFTLLSFIFTSFVIDWTEIQLEFKIKNTMLYVFFVTLITMLYVISSF